MADWPLTGFLQVGSTVTSHLGDNFEKLMAHLLSEEERNRPEEEEPAMISLEHMRSCFFGDYMDVDNEPEDRKYAEIQDVTKLISNVEEYLTDHNGMSKRPMDLAMFLFAVEHVSRICRLLKQPGGHMLLVGVGGSGRQSLARLGAFICGMTLFQVRVDPLLCA